MNIRCWIKKILGATPDKQQRSTSSLYAKAMADLKGDVIIAELENGSYIVDELFMQVFGHPAPTHGHHIVTFCRLDDGSYRVANYLNYWIKNGACYVGGAVTDRDLIKNKISKKLLVKISQYGGLYPLSVMHLLEHQLGPTSAIFGHTSVPRALEVILELGFVATDEPYLYVKWAPCVSERNKKSFLVQAKEIGDF